MAIFIEGGGMDRIENTEKIFGNLTAGPCKLLEVIKEYCYHQAPGCEIEGWALWDSEIGRGRIINRIYFFEITGIVRCQ